MQLAAILIVAYLIGSIPFGLLLARTKGIDIRRHGSGNIGATNVWRVLGRRLGLLCFALDVLKGLAPAVAAGLWLGTIPDVSAPTERVLMWLSAPAACMLGHIFPVWLGFKGGKGVATGLGAMLGVFPVLTLAGVGALGVWLLSVRLTRMVGISSAFAAMSLPILVAVQAAMPIGWYEALGAATGPTTDSQLVNASGSSTSWAMLWPYLAVTVPLAAAVLWRHRANIRRTLDGTENRIGDPG